MANEAPQSPACRARSSLPLASIIGSQKKRPAADAKASALHTLNSHRFTPEAHRFYRRAYIVDFLSVQPKLVIEVDGGQHAETTLQDAQRTEYVQRLGYQMVRYWNDQVVWDVEAVMESIRAALI